MGERATQPKAAIDEVHVIDHATTAPETDIGVEGRIDGAV